ncbi:hypothetical protein DSECCO2_632660 [anaerobic digester metagenome]
MYPLLVQGLISQFPVLHLAQPHSVLLDQRWPVRTPIFPTQQLPQDLEAHQPISGITAMLMDLQPLLLVLRPVREALRIIQHIPAVCHKRSASILLAARMTTCMSGVLPRTVDAAQHQTILRL